MRPILISAILLGILAGVDLYFSNRLDAAATHFLVEDSAFLPVNAVNSVDSVNPVNAVQVGEVSRLANHIGGQLAAQTEAEESVQLVESALNSRYMQWGAVGVMLGLFVWLITRHLPNQERMRKEESDEVRGSFLRSIDMRDQYYLGELRDIRKSVETHVDKLHEAKDRQANALNELASTIRLLGDK